MAASRLLDPPCAMPSRRQRSIRCRARWRSTPTAIWWIRQSASSRSGRTKHSRRTTCASTNILGPRRPRNDTARMTTVDLLLQQTINGLSLGSMYALLALGFTLVYGILELINFAHFNVFMVSSFIGMWALELLGLSGQSTVLGGFALVGTLAFAFIVTMLAAGLLGVAIERIALRPLRNVRGTAAMITTIGVSFILFNVILLTAGAGSMNFPNPMPVVRWDVAGATLQLREVLIWT